ncbi:hypothetical protein Hanom_Chr17g01562181 [Helianthus anomalus]
MNNFTSPTPHLFSISIKPLMTIYKCPKDLDYVAKHDQPDYNSYNRCKDHNFYYEHLISLTPVPSDHPNRCEVIQLPREVDGPAPNYTDIFSLLTSKFPIQFWSPSCDECHKKGHCHHPNFEDFECSYAKKGINGFFFPSLFFSLFPAINLTYLLSSHSAEKKLILILGNLPLPIIHIIYILWQKIKYK